MSADLENGFADDPSAVFATVTDALTRAGRELLGHGTYGFMDLAVEGGQQGSAVFGDR